MLVNSIATEMNDRVSVRDARSKVCWADDGSVEDVGVSNSDQAGSQHCRAFTPATLIDGVMGGTHSCAIESIWVRETTHG